MRWANTRWGAPYSLFLCTGNFAFFKFSHHELLTRVGDIVVFGGRWFYSEDFSLTWLTGCVVEDGERILGTVPCVPFELRLTLFHAFLYACRHRLCQREITLQAINYHIRWYKYPIHVIWWQNSTNITLLGFILFFFISGNSYGVFIRLLPDTHCHIVRISNRLLIRLL